MRRETLDDILRDAFDALPRAVREGSAKGAATARRALAAMDVAGRDATETTLATRANVRIAATTSLARCFAVGDGGVGAGGAGGIGGAGGSTPPPCSPPTPPPPPTPPTPPLLLWRVDARRTCPTRNSTAKSPPSRARSEGTSAPSPRSSPRASTRSERLWRRPPRTKATNRRRRCGDAARARTSSRSTKHSSEPRNVTRRRCYRRRSRSRRWLAKRARFVSATRRARFVSRDATATARGARRVPPRGRVEPSHVRRGPPTRTRASNGRGTGGDGDGSTPTRFASEVGGFDSDAATVRENALLVSLAAEGVGAAARVGGREFIRRGGFLPLALCPLLRRLGDPAPDVRDAARHALEVTARVGGYTPDEGTEGGEEGGDPPAASSTPVGEHDEGTEGGEEEARPPPPPPPPTPPPPPPPPSLRWSPRTRITSSLSSLVVFVVWRTTPTPLVFSPRRSAAARRRRGFSSRFSPSRWVARWTRYPSRDEERTTATSPRS